MNQLMPTLISLPFLAFWAWMFWDAAHNDYLAGNSKMNWMLAFILLNIFAAAYYYFVEYRSRHL